MCLMAVLAMTPGTILLDEPFAGLDLPTGLHLSAVLDGLDQQIVMVTHDPERLAGYEQVIWIDAGVLRHMGPPDEVLPVYDAEMRSRVGAVC